MVEDTSPLDLFLKTETVTLYLNVYENVMESDSYRYHPYLFRSEERAKVVAEGERALIIAHPIIIRK
jgi:hypothetical protein